ncbi:hypothetical protein Hanom_Chr07g00638171 [Helianthus anomalus]
MDNNDKNSEQTDNKNNEQTDNKNSEQTDNKNREQCRKCMETCSACTEKDENLRSRNVEFTKIEKKIQRKM